MSRGRAVLALGLVEARRLVVHPLVGLAFVPTAYWVHGVRRTDRYDGVGDDYYLLTGFGFLLPSVAVMAVSAFAGLRDRRGGAGDLLGVVPLDPGTRVVGHGVSAVAAAGLGLVAIGVMYAALAPGAVIGRAIDVTPVDVNVPRPSLAQMAQGPLFLAFVASLVLALVRWIPSWFVLAPMSFLVLMMQGLWFGLFEANPTGPSTWLLPMATGSVQDGWRGQCGQGQSCDLALAGFDRATPWWHAGYLVAFIGVLVSIGVLRHRRDRKAWLAFGVLAGLTVALAVVQLAVYERYPASGRLG